MTFRRISQSIPLHRRNAAPVPAAPVTDALRHFILERTGSASRTPVEAHVSRDTLIVRTSSSALKEIIYNERAALFRAIGRATRREAPTKIQFR